MNNIVEAEYTVVSEHTLPEIIAEIKIIEQNVAKTAMEGAIQIGQRLQEAKEQVGHGGFDAWCQENLSYNRRTAERFMKIASEYGDEDGLFSKTTTLSHLSISNALSLLKVPEEDRETFVEQHPVADMTNKALEEEIRKLKEENEKNQADMEALREMKEDAEAETGQALGEVAELKRQLDVAKASAADQKELERLHQAYSKSIDERAKLEEQLHKKKNQLKKEKDGKQAAIDEAVEKERQNIIDEANKEAADRMQQITGENDDLRKQLTETKRKLEAVSRGSIVQFKVLTNQLQDVFDKCGTVIVEENDQELSQKMEAALRQIVQAFGEAL